MVFKNIGLPAFTLVSYTAHGLVLNFGFLSVCVYVLEGEILFWQGRGEQACEVAAHAASTLGEEKDDCSVPQFYKFRNFV